MHPISVPQKVLFIKTILSRSFRRPLPPEEARRSRNSSFYSSLMKYSLPLYMRHFVLCAQNFCLSAAALTFSQSRKLFTARRGWVGARDKKALFNYLNFYAFLYSESWNCFGAFWGLIIAWPGSMICCTQLSWEAKLVVAGGGGRRVMEGKFNLCRFTLLVFSTLPFPRNIIRAALRLLYVRRKQPSKEGKNR